MKLYEGCKWGSPPKNSTMSLMKSLRRAPFFGYIKTTNQSCSPLELLVYYLLKNIVPFKIFSHYVMCLCEKVLILWSKFQCISLILREEIIGYRINGSTSWRCYKGSYQNMWYLFFKLDTCSWYLQGNTYGCIYQLNINRTNDILVLNK